ncbi:hypothetical protein ACFLT7_05520 [candidate division KSB1 bacterium]
MAADKNNPKEPFRSAFKLLNSWIPEAEKADRARGRGPYLAKKAPRSL